MGVPGGTGHPRFMTWGGGGGGGAQVSTHTACSFITPLIELIWLEY